MNLEENLRARMAFTSRLRQLIDYGYANNLFFVPTYIYRDKETQQRLYDNGASKTLNSKHLFALAIDIVVINMETAPKAIDNGQDERYYKLGIFWESLGGQWGGRFDIKPGQPDSGHFAYWPFK